MVQRRTDTVGGLNCDQNAHFLNPPCKLARSSTMDCDADIWFVKLQMLTVLNEMLFKERQPGAGPRLAADRTLIMPSDGFGLGLQVHSARVMSPCQRV